MPAIRSIIPGAMALALAACSPAGRGAPEIAVSNGWTREIAPGQSAAAVYLTIANKGDGDDRLTAIQSSRGEATLHATSSSDGVARMRPLEDGLDVPAGSTVALKPGGTHIMLTGLDRRIGRGETVALTLRFERSGQRPAAIRVVGAGDDGHADHGMKM